MFPEMRKLAEDKLQFFFGNIFPNRPGLTWLESAGKTKSGKNSDRVTSSFLRAQFPPKKTLEIFLFFFYVEKGGDFFAFSFISKKSSLSLEVVLFEEDNEEICLIRYRNTTNQN
jgi:hypothetical protein